MKTTIAVALLISSTSAVQVKNMLRAQMPVLPTGAEIADLLAQGANELNKMVPDLMFAKKQDCWMDYDYETGAEKQQCYDYEDGLRRELRRGQEDLSRAADNFGVKLPEQLYDSKFLTDLIEAEFNDVTKALNSPDAKAMISGEIDGVMGDIKSSAQQLGLAQLKSKLAAKKSAAAAFATTSQDTAAVVDDASEPAAQPDTSGSAAVTISGGDEAKDCWDQFYDQPREECDWNLPEDQMVCPGECCWRGPNDEAEEKAFNQYYDDQWKVQQEFLTSCFLENSQLAREAGKELPPQAELSGEITKALNEFINNIKSKDEVEELAGDIGQLNDVLTAEATRLNLEVPTLPDPQATAQGIIDLLVNASTAVVDNTSPYADRVESADKLAADVRFGVVQDAYQAERELTRTLGVNPITDPDAAMARIEGQVTGLKKAMDGGEFDRELEEAAGVLGDLGLGEYNTKDALKGAIDAALDDADKLLVEPDLQQELEGDAMALEKEVQVVLEAEAAQKVEEVEEEASKA